MITIDDEDNDVVSDTAGTASCAVWVEQYLDHHCSEKKVTKKRVPSKQVWDAWNVALSTAYHMVGQFREGCRGIGDGSEYDAGAIDMAELIQQEIKTLYVNKDEEDARERRKKK